MLWVGLATVLSLLFWVPAAPIRILRGPTACHSARLEHQFAETGQICGLVSGRSDSAALAIVIPVFLHPCLPMI